MGYLIVILILAFSFYWDYRTPDTNEDRAQWWDKILMAPCLLLTLILIGNYMGWYILQDAFNKGE